MHSPSNKRHYGIQRLEYETKAVETGDNVYVLIPRIALSLEKLTKKWWVLHH